MFALLSIGRAMIRRPAAPLILGCCGLLLAGCQSSSKPSDPDPDPSGGQVVVLRNDSNFEAFVGAGDCREARRVTPTIDDFSPVHLDYDLSCSAEAQGEGHSGNMRVEGLVDWTFDGPDEGLSEVRMVATSVGNRSRTGLASSGAVLQVKFRFEVAGEPVVYRASGRIDYADHFSDFFVLKPLGAAPGAELFAEYGQNVGEAGSLMLDEFGTLSPGTYELWVALSTHDWFTEEVEFLLRFEAP